MGYDTCVVQTPPDSLAVLWHPRYRGRINRLTDVGAFRLYDRAWTELKLR